MSTVEQALAVAIDAQARASVDLATAQAQLSALQSRRDNTEAKLTPAREAIRAASAAVIGGGSEKALDAAIRDLEQLQAVLATFDKEVMPAARTACEAAEAVMPSAAMVAALELRLAALQRLSPLYARHSELASQLGALLDEIVREAAALRSEYLPAWATLFAGVHRAILGPVLRCVPPAARDVYALMFVDIAHQPVHEDRAMSFDPEALENFLEVTDQEPSHAELKRFNPLAKPPAPPISPEPPVELGPAKWRALDVREPGNRAASAGEG